MHHGAVSADYPIFEKLTTQCLHFLTATAWIGEACAPSLETVPCLCTCCHVLPVLRLTGWRRHASHQSAAAEAWLTEKSGQAHRARPQSWEDCSCKCAPWTVCSRLQQFPGGPRLDLGGWGEAWESGRSSNTPSYCKHIKWGLWNYHDYKVVEGGRSDQQVMAHSCLGRKPLSPSLPRTNAAPSTGRVGFFGGRVLCWECECKLNSSRMQGCAPGNVGESGIISRKKYKTKPQNTSIPVCAESEQ